MLRAHLRRLGALSLAEWRCLGAACAVHSAVRVLLVLVPLDAMLRLADRPWGRPRRPLSLAQVTRMARWSRRVCGGTCLTESLVAATLARRHGHQAPVTIGVSIEGGRLRAHAWAEPSASGADEFVQIWPEGKHPQ